MSVMKNKRFADKSHFKQGSCSETGRTNVVGHRHTDSTDIK